MESTLGFSHFFAQSDAAGKTVMFILLVMSIATWYLIAAKAWQGWIARRRAAKFLDCFWNAPSIGAVAAHLRANPPDDAFASLTQQGILAREHHRRLGPQRLSEAGTLGEFLTRALRRALDQETARLEAGLTLLASVGSSAPFVGLFGTVWGIYHALIQIGMSGQGTLDKVAGPVGEALIMTAAGLAVAIPAVLAYNFFTRANRVVLDRLDGFAHDLYAFLVTGTRIEETGFAEAPVKPAATARAADASGRA